MREFRVSYARLHAGEDALKVLPAFAGSARITLLTGFSQEARAYRAFQQGPLHPGKF